MSTESMQQQQQDTTTPAAATASASAVTSAAASAADPVRQRQQPQDMHASKEEEEKAETTTDLLDEKLKRAPSGPAGHDDNGTGSNNSNSDGSKSSSSSEPFKSKHLTSVAGTANEATSERRRNKYTATNSTTTTLYSHPVYGRPIQVETSGNFPSVGSTLGHYFCLGRLGKGTFSSIHKCVNLGFFHEQGDNNDNVNNTNVNTNARRLAAAKVELSDFAQSGVLEAEATILAFLHYSLPPKTVPVYMGHYRSGEYAAILMEYLPGEDMHVLREKVITGTMSRRMSVKDSVYLTADVMLPLLQRMHKVGVVHRDVKPSNCVRSGGPSNKDFCIVDFGLSKSIVVPSNSPMADTEHPWPESAWLKPHAYSGPGCLRKEREKADFRGTSMYASLRVHQLRDYSPRDDMWGLLYVFCDLVSGGLPWMSHAANRDREMCEKLKAKVLGDGTGNDEMEQLLMGDAYHVTLFRRQKQEAKQEASGETERLSTVPEPLPMHKDEVKVAALRRAFQHVAGLQFWDVPDYNLIQGCIHEFLKNNVADPDVRSIDWAGRPDSPSFMSSPALKRNASGAPIPNWHIATATDPLQDDAFEDAEAELKAEPSDDKSAMSRLPVDLRFYLQQIDYNEKNRDDVAPHLALRDWMRVAGFLLYEDWDARKYEEGGHRTSTDGFRRENYLRLLQRCDDCARAFKDKFRSRLCFYQSGADGNNGDNSSLESDPLTKKRKIMSDSASSSSSSNFAAVSRALVDISASIKAETKKKSAPPMTLSFGF